MAEIYQEANRLIAQILKNDGHGIKGILFNKKQKMENQKRQGKQTSIASSSPSSSYAGSKPVQRSSAVIALVLQSLKCTNFLSEPANEGFVPCTIILIFP